jgi:hypothetical protein
MEPERREFSRIPIPFGQSATFLRKGRQQFTVHLLNASPQGYAVTCPERLTVGQNDVLQLRTSEGWVEVRVARIEPFEVGTDIDDEFDCFIGLERLRDLGYGPDDAFVMAGNPRWVLACGMALAFALGVIAVVLLVPTFNSDWPRIPAVFKRW